MVQEVESGTSVMEMAILPLTVDPDYAGLVKVITSQRCNETVGQVESVIGSMPFRSHSDRTVSSFFH